MMRLGDVVLAHWTVYHVLWFDFWPRQIILEVHSTSNIINQQKTIIYYNI